LQHRQYSASSKLATHSAAAAQVGVACPVGRQGAGEASMTKCLEILHKELDITMEFCGHTDIRSVDKKIMIPGSFP
jgi:L-lactate dehydrogenase (cytochrome)